MVINSWFPDSPGTKGILIFLGSYSAVELPTIVLQTRHKIIFKMFYEPVLVCCDIAKKFWKHYHRNVAPMIVFNSASVNPIKMHESYIHNLSWINLVLLPCMFPCHRLSPRTWTAAILSPFLQLTVPLRKLASWSWTDHIFFNELSSLSGCIRLCLKHMHIIQILLINLVGSWDH